MCGIAGVLGRPGAAALVHAALEALEYRGYDSCGIAWTQAAGGNAKGREGRKAEGRKPERRKAAVPRLEVRKAVGAVAGLQVPGAGTAALGHTRWATHGGVSEANAHPHLDCKGQLAIVHNGVLANHAELRARLERGGHTFRSGTDSEVLAHLWEEADVAGGPAAALAALRSLQASLHGTYSLAILDARDGAVYFAKERNPLWVASEGGATFLASDPVALRRHAGSAVPLEDGDHGRAVAGAFEVRDRAGRPARRAAVPLGHLDDRAGKAGYEHFMLKEIHEAPAALNRLVVRHVLQEPPYFDLGLPARLLRLRRAACIGAGTSYHAARLAAMHLERVGGVAAAALAAPEYKDDAAVPEPGTLLVAFSQSGETLDTLQALHRLRSHPHPLVAATNHPTSSLARQADAVVPLRCGTEVSVAATKTFLSQAAVGYLLALAMGRALGNLGDAQAAHLARGLVLLPRGIDRTLRRNDAIAGLARSLLGFENLFVLAKGWLLPVAMEGALKLKEIAYQHAEAYPAGELKHGPFALLTPQTAVLFLHQPGDLEESLLNSIHEVEARGAPTFVLAMEGARVEGVPDGNVVWLPAVAEEVSPLVFASALHLLSYWVAKGRALPIDRPRNLAKSVTVE